MDAFFGIICVGTFFPVTTEELSNVSVMRTTLETGVSIMSPVPSLSSYQVKRCLVCYMRKAWHVLQGGKGIIYNILEVVT